MSFDRTWVLFLVWVPLAWAAWEWRGAGRRAGLLLKAGAFAAILLALAAPRVTVFESRTAVVVLADTSASVTAQDLRTESALAGRVMRGRGRNWASVIPFARGTRPLSGGERAKGELQLLHTAGAAGHGTDLESAVRDGLASPPAGLTPRLLLISDGNENTGSVARAVWQAQRLGVPIDTAPLAGHTKPSLTLESVSVPSQVFSGERFPIEVTLHSPKASSATVETMAEGKPLGESRVELAAGANRLRLQARVNAAGAVALSGKVMAPGLGELRFESAATLRRPRALVVSSDPADSEAHLRHTLEANQFDVESAPNGVPEKLDGFQLLIVNNWDMNEVPPLRKAAIEDFVKKGGGLLYIAGERSIYVEKKREDALDQSLPAKLAPPRSRDGAAVALVIDKSASMEGRKIELARLAATGVVNNLRLEDTVGVLVFDNTFQWAVPMRRVDERASINRLIAGIQPDGGTQIAPALAEAYKRILPQNAMYKHIVLLTDGISEEGESVTLAEQARANRVTISTVGLGQDVNRGLLEKIAETSEGKTYFLSEPAGLEQILLRDVQEHTGTTAVETNVKPRVLDQADVLEGVGIENAPALRGYVRFESRATADAILAADRKDPLLVRWQYGLGRSAVFASDAKNRWAADWLTWPGYDRFWANVCRDLLPHASDSEATADYDRAGNELLVDYHLSRNVEDLAAVPDVYAFGANGFQAPLKLSKVAAGHYRARLPLGSLQGFIRVRPLAESRAFPEVGFYLPEDEMADYGSNEALLRQVAAATGGRFNPTVEQVFDPGNRRAQATVQLWPGLLALAVLLNLLELAGRKWTGLREALSLRRWRAASPAAPALR